MMLMMIILMMIILMSMVMMLMTMMMMVVMMMTVMMTVMIMMLITLSTFEASLCSDLEHFQILLELLKDLSSFLDRLSFRAYL